MGDTGSLALGGALGAIAVATHHEIVLVIIGGLFVLEAMSRHHPGLLVYKRTGKRVFRMAPIHHHFEHLGWSEPTVVIRFWIVAFVLALAGLVDAQAAVITARAFARQDAMRCWSGALRAGDRARRCSRAAPKVTAWDDNASRTSGRPSKLRVAIRLDADPSFLIENSMLAGPRPDSMRRRLARRAAQPPSDRANARARPASPLIGDIELFARARPELPPHKVVGITGTNGKSTTTALIHHILKTAGVPTTMGGNIGLPILAQDPLPEGGVYVLELSSYQIDLTHSLDCDVAVLLNITPDHLDRYDELRRLCGLQGAAVRDASSRATSRYSTGDDQFGYDAYRERCGRR